jgi:hypothetical protein
MAHAAPETAPSIDAAFATTSPGSTVTVESDLMATPERADAAEVKLDRTLGDRLSRIGIPRTWDPPSSLRQSIVLNRVRQEIPKDYAVMHRESLQVDVSPAMLSRFKQSYEADVAGHRLVILGEILLFVLVVLAALAGYIHADEATKGYYTNHLRLATAAGIGAASVVAYRLLV